MGLPMRRADCLRRPPRCSTSSWPRAPRLPGKGRQETRAGLNRRALVSGVGERERESAHVQYARPSHAPCTGRGMSPMRMRRSCCTGSPYSLPAPPEGQRPPPTEHSISVHSRMGARASHHLPLHVVVSPHHTPLARGARLTEVFGQVPERIVLLGVVAGKVLRHDGLVDFDVDLVDKTQHDGRNAVAKVFEESSDRACVRPS